MDQLRKQGIESSMPTVRSEHHVTNNLSPAHRQLSTDSVSSLASQLTNLSSASSSSPPQAANGGAGSAQMAIPSASSPSPSPSLKKKSWLRNSFSKAFSRSKRGQSSSRGGSDTEDSGPVSTWSAPSSPLLASHHPHHPSIHSQSTHSSLDESASTPEMVDELKKQLREKDMVLTDIRLEALSSAHQLEALKETVSRMRVSPRFSFSPLNAVPGSDSYICPICSLPLALSEAHDWPLIDSNFSLSSTERNAVAQTGQRTSSASHRTSHSAKLYAIFRPQLHGARQRARTASIFGRGRTDHDR